MRKVPEAPIQIGADDFCKIDDELYLRVWEVVKTLDEREKHFNDLQAEYRSLASTWLLAAFAGIGFVLSTTLTPSVPVEALVTGIAIAGAIGIALLWVLDVLVYHDLLVVGYVAGQHLERVFPWLPPVRTQFRRQRRLKPVRKYVALFYTAGIVVLCLAAATVIIASGKAKVWAFIALGVAIALSVVIYWLTNRALLATADFEPWITDSSKSLPSRNLPATS